MQIANFINPPGEDVDDDDGDIITQIVARYERERDAESDEEDHDQPKISTPEAIQALDKLQLYESQQEGDTADVQRLNVWRYRIQHRQIVSKHQTSIYEYFSI